MKNTACQPAAFLDRDGTLIRAVDYLRDPSEVVVPAEVIQGLRLLRDAGFLLLLISNQSGISRGYFTQDDLAAVHARMSQLLALEKIHLDAYYYCPHSAVPGACQCRKPLTGMLEQACQEFKIDREHSCMIGDDDCDMQLAQNFAIPGLLLKTERVCDESLATRVCADFLEAARLAVNELEAHPSVPEL